MIPSKIEKLLAQLERDGQSLWGQRAPAEPVTSPQPSPENMRAAIRILWEIGALSDTALSHGGRKKSNLWTTRMLLQQQLGLPAESFDWGFDVSGTPRWFDRHYPADDV